MSEIRNTDIELWNRWHTTRSPADLERLMAQMMPVIRNEMVRWKNVVPPIVLEMEAKKLALAAFETFDPKRGNLLSTHLVANGLRKLSRLGYEHQSTLSVPEHQRITYNKIQKVKALLENDLGRKPSIEEVADHLALPVKHVKGIVGNVERKEFLESGEGPAFEQQNDDDVIHLAYNDMTPIQRQIFEMRTGYNKTTTPDVRKIRKGADIMRELNLTQGQLSYQIGKIEELLNKANRFR